jgi:hypothetical protein
MGGPPHLFPLSSVLLLTLEKLWSIKVKEMMYFHSLHPHDGVRGERVWWGVVGGGGLGGG